MICISREMITTEKSGDFYAKCQASLNSDGAITLRHYNPCNKNKDEIVILSGDETQAIFRLMRKIKTITADDSLPF